jgi:hypothetical protein
MLMFFILVVIFFPKDIYIYIYLINFIFSKNYLQWKFWGVDVKNYTNKKLGFSILYKKCCVKQLKNCTLGFICSNRNNGITFENLMMKNG